MTARAQAGRPRRLPVSVAALLVAALLLGGCGFDEADHEPSHAAFVEALLRHTVAIEIVGDDDEGPFVSHGAGTILHEAGYVLTCEHITVETAHQRVILADGRSVPYRVLARAGGTYDMAILRIDTQLDLEPVTISRRLLVDVREPVFIVGTPHGHRLTVLDGVVDLPDCGGGTQLQVGGVDVLPGYSGGPVFDRDAGQIALVHVAITTADDMSRHIRADHLRNGFARVFLDETRHPWRLGLDVDTTSSADGARVTAVRQGSAADEAGIEVGDVIVGLDDFVVRDGIHYALALLDRLSAAPVAVRFVRDGREERIEVVPRRR